MPTSCSPTGRLQSIVISHERMTARWNVPSFHDTTLGAGFQSQAAGPMLMLAMRAPPLTGAVSAHDQGSQSYCGILFNLQGHQRVSSSTRSSKLAPGDILLWNSEASCDFEVLAPQAKLQILVPRDLLERLVPDLVPDKGWTHLEGQKPMQVLARTCVETLWRQRLDYSAVELSAALEASLELLGQCTRPAMPARRSKEQVFSLVRRYIDRHLDDPDLGPASLARRHGLSLRSLHALFAERQLTVAGLIRERRLEACRRALGVSTSGQITDVALRSGFNDAAHFSRLFKSTYGMSPRQYRQSANTCPSL